ncbi:MAG: LuxR C-terminal-related transcriptional regulator [Candidatus Azobacteroides sp.]|nr:LuxR C-terminal-related transcriptional regulator [Candidatus Azobacteroides sp.]
MLTNTDKKLCAMLKMNMSSKEIAELTNISVRSVELSRYRLRKKIGLEREDNLTEWIHSVEKG